MADVTAILDGRSIAIIGASSDPGKIGGRPISYLLRDGYAGRIVPVNPVRKEIQGLPCYADIRDAEPVDLAIIATPQTGAGPAIEACIEAKARAMILFTAGFAEASADGALEQRRMAAAANDAGAVLLGPNCLGAINFKTHLTATFATVLETLTPRSGAFSYFGQSGALGGYWIENAHNAGLGLCKWLSTGNEAQVDGADALAYLAKDDATTIIGCYLEDIKRPDQFAAAAEEARAAGKRIIALKSGRSTIGLSAAAAHTASQSREDSWYDGFFRETGVHRVASLTGMVDAARLIDAPRAPKSASRLAVMTISGGAGTLICDAADERGVGLATFSSALASRLAEILPGYARAQNPVDMTGALVGEPALLSRLIEPLAQSRECDGLLLFLGSMGGIADQLISGLQTAVDQGLPIAVIWMAAPSGAAERISSMGIPVFNEIDRALDAFSILNAPRAQDGVPKVEARISLA